LCLNAAPGDGALACQSAGVLPLAGAAWVSPGAVVLDDSGTGARRPYDPRPGPLGCGRRDFSGAPLSRLEAVLHPYLGNRGIPGIPGMPPMPGIIPPIFDIIFWNF